MVIDKKPHWGRRCLYVCVDLFIAGNQKLNRNQGELLNRGNAQDRLPMKIGGVALSRMVSPLYQCLSVHVPLLFYRLQTKDEPGAHSVFL